MLRHPIRPRPRDRSRILGRRPCLDSERTHQTQELNMGSKCARSATVDAHVALAASGARAPAESDFAPGGSQIVAESPRSSSLPLLPTIPDFGQKPRWAVHWRGQSGAHCLQQYGVIHDANTCEESRAHHPNTKTPRREYKGTVSPSSCKNY